MKTKALSVRLQGKHTGVLQQDHQGKLLFTYDESASRAISLSMPITQATYDDAVCQAFFGGLLPEGHAARKMIGQRFGVSPYNTFSLLKVIGHDCAGAVSCHEMSEPEEAQSYYDIQARVVADHELYQHIMELPERPLFVDVDGLRLSLAGAQDKAAVCLIDGNIALAENGCPTTHLLKPSPRRFPDLAVNEYFCMKLAKRLGLPVPEVVLYQLEDITFLLVERYDRQIKGNTIQRIHQEDFCQALGVVSSNKYQNEGGPGLVDCFNLLDQVRKPAVDRYSLASVMVFNFLTGNMDAHAKNFSLLHMGNDDVQLAPFYDLVCTKVYAGLTRKMAMKIGSQYDAERVRLRHWEQLGEQISFRYVALKRLLQEQGALLLTAAHDERETLFEHYGEFAIVNDIVTFLEKNINKIINDV